MRHTTVTKSGVCARDRQGGPTTIWKKVLITVSIGGRDKVSLNYQKNFVAPVMVELRSLITNFVGGGGTRLGMQIRRQRVILK